MVLIVHWTDGNKSIFANMQWEITSIDKMLRLHCGDSYRGVHIKECYDPSHDPMGNDNIHHVFATADDWEITND